MTILSHFQFFISNFNYLLSRKVKIWISVNSTLVIKYKNLQRQMNSCRAIAWHCENIFHHSMCSFDLSFQQIWGKACFSSSGSYIFSLKFKLFTKQLSSLEHHFCHKSSMHTPDKTTQAPLGTQSPALQGWRRRSPSKWGCHCRWFHIVEAYIGHLPGICLAYETKTIKAYAMYIKYVVCNMSIPGK